MHLPPCDEEKENMLCQMNHVALLHLHKLHLCAWYTGAVVSKSAVTAQYECSCFLQHQALVRAQKNQMGEVAENILMYMQAVNHDQLSEV